MSGLHVFAGPSLFGVEAAVARGLTLHPPARRGDLLRVCQAGARIIGLVDGYFGDTAAVWHKEILFALSRGVAVYGAASMGALRAAECAQFGMVGIGRVFRDYASGIRQSDADVAVVHAPAELDYRPLTVALVDAEDVAHRLRKAGRVSPAQSAMIRFGARGLHYSQRTWPLILQRASLGPRVSRSLLAEIATMPGTKSEDAVELLKTLSRQPTDKGQDRLLPHCPRTVFLAALEASVAAEPMQRTANG